MVAQVTAAFPTVIVVLNIDGIIDTGWIKNDPAIGTALLAWQGGMEGGCVKLQVLVLNLRTNINANPQDFFKKFFHISSAYDKMYFILHTERECCI